MRLGPGGGSDPVRQHRQISLVIMLTASRSTMCRLKWQLLDESMLRSTRCGARCSIVFGSLTVFQDIMLAGQKVWQEMLKKDEAVR